MTDQKEHAGVVSADARPEGGTTKLIVAKQQAPATFTPTNLNEAIQFSKLIASSDLAPRDFKGKPGNVLIALQMGAEVGLKPLQALQNIAIINGRPSLWGDGALAVVMAHPDFEDIEETTEGTCATCKVKRKGRTPVTRRFSDADAQAAGLLTKDGPWKTYRSRMRAMRARGFALRDSFADALRGLILAEEAMDMPPERPQRERGAIGPELLSTLAPSQEPNRGHGSEGMEKAAEQVLVDPAGVAPKPKELVRGLVTVVKVDPKIKKSTDQPYFVLTCQDKRGDAEYEVASWHKHLHEHVVRMQGKVCDITIERRSKGDSLMYALETIHRIGDVRFENDVPVNLDAEPTESGTLQQPTGGELFDK